MLEPDEAKVSSPVLRGLAPSNGGWLLGAWRVRELSRGELMKMWRSAIWRRTSIRITTPSRISGNNIWPRWVNCLCSCELKAVEVTVHREKYSFE
jgi:hypothetical protein